MHIPGLPDNFVYQEVIDDSTVLINPTLAQQQITNNPSIVEDGNDSNESELSSSQFVNNNVVNQQQLDINSSSNVQGGNPSQKLTNDDANQQSPIESPQHNLSQIMNTNPFGDNNSQRSEGQQTFRPSDPIQDLSQIMNMNIFSSDNSQNDQQDYQNSSKGVLSEEQSTSFAFPKRSNSNSSIIEESGGNDANNELDFKENIRRVLKAQKSDLETQIKYGKDLAEHIPGLYRLLDLCKDDGSNGLVDKIIISKGSLKILCNEMIPLSFKSISDINFTKYDLLANSQSSMDKSFLRPGLYLLLVNPDLGLVVHWPEIGCYEENASSQRKKNMTNLHRYLTKLTDHQLCLMSDKDLEIKKSQEEQEDFKIYPGFEVNLSDKIKTEINNNIQDDIPLYPIVVESATNQSFVTRQLIKTASQLRSAAPIFTAFDFQRELQTRLKGRNLHINRETMNMKSLEILIKHGLKMEDELLGPLRNAIAAAKMKYDKKKDQEKDETSKDIEIISNLAWKKLRDSYSPFEDFIGQESSEHEHISDEDLERIRRKYPDMEAQIDKKILINSKAWGKLKKRYALTSIIVVDIFKMTKNAGKSNEEATIEIFYNMFVDEETDTHKLVKKHTEKPQSSGVFSGISNLFTAFLDIITFSSSSINRADEESIKISKTMSDKKFVQDLANSPFFGKFNDIKQKILGIFFEEYQNWRKNTFPSNIKEILPRVSFNKQLSERLTKEFEQEKQEIEDFEFDRICNVIEEKYQDGSMRLNIRNISVSESLFSNGYRFYHEIETTQPNQLQITIYETSLEQADILQLQEDELHVPNPTLPSHYSRGQSFHLDPQVYDFRKISQFDNHKFLLVLWNKRASKTEIFFDTAQKLAQNFKQSYSNRPFKTLNMDENYFIAVNESKELIAIFDTRKVVLNVFSFNDGQANLYSRNSNI
ncbi:15960_t:CDS:10, partial [Rhizophagus irregularis]